MAKLLQKKSELYTLITDIINIITESVYNTTNKYQLITLRIY